MGVQCIALLKTGVGRAPKTGVGRAPKTGVGRQSSPADLYAHGNPVAGCGSPALTPVFSARRPHDTLPRECVPRSQTMTNQGKWVENGQRIGLTGSLRIHHWPRDLDGGPEGRIERAAQARERLECLHADVGSGPQRVVDVKEDDFAEDE